MGVLAFRRYDETCQCYYFDDIPDSVIISIIAGSLMLCIIMANYRAIIDMVRQWSDCLHSTRSSERATPSSYQLHVHRPDDHSMYPMDTPRSSTGSSLPPACNPSNGNTTGSPSTQSVPSPLPAPPTLLTARPGAKPAQLTVHADQPSTKVVPMKQSQAQFTCATIEQHPDEDPSQYTVLEMDDDQSWTQTLPYLQFPPPAHNRAIYAASDHGCQYLGPLSNASSLNCLVPA